MEVPVRQLVWYLLVLWALVSSVCGDRLLDKMYASIYGAVCFRRLNGTHSTGCGSSHSGSVGALHLIQTAADFEFVWNKPPSPPYTLIVPPHLFTRENILNVTAQSAPKKTIAGIVLIDSDTQMESFSHELKCPNQYSGLADQTCDARQSNTTWNPFGTGLLHENFPFPIVYVKDPVQIANLTECYFKYNSNDLKNQHRRSLCSIQIKSFMSAAVSSEVCIRRTKYTNNMNPQRYCDPLQSKNVYATAFPRPVESSAPAVDYIVLAARIDTTSMFDGIGVGAMDSLVPAVTLMTTAHTLTKMLGDINIQHKNNILFMLFNGEAYDYIGSQRFVWDLEQKAFPSKDQPIDIKQIKLLIDIGSMDSPNATTIYQHPNFNGSNEFIQLFNATIQRYRLNYNVTQKTTNELPPTSAQSFLRNSTEFPAIILYSDTNKNRFYHSIFDNETNIGFVYRNTSKDFTSLVDLTASDEFKLVGSVQMAIRNASTALAVSLYQLTTGKEWTTNLAANPFLVDEMLHCYLQSAKCRLFEAVVKDPTAVTIQPLPPNRYISVSNSISYETVGWTYRVLGFVTGRPEPMATKDNCTELPLAWFAGINGTGQCLRTTQNLSNAYSPAFILDNYDWSSGRYSTWTESTWSEITIRIFLKPAVYHEAFTMAIGLTVLILSFLFVYIINSKSDVLFGESTSSINVLTLPSQC